MKLNYCHVFPTMYYITHGCPGWTFNIPDTLMALTFVAAGTSVPDALTSLMVARQGERSPAITLSSNRVCT